jgi:hypothetical protein
MDIKYNTEPAISKPDPVSLAQQAKYKQQGLTVTSNDTSIIPRDSAGNIILQENSETNPALIIEPVTTKITTDSILRVIETRFQYYSFPATVRAVPSAAIDFNIDISDPAIDPIFARYKPNANYEIETYELPKNLPAPPRPPWANSATTIIPISTTDDAPLPPYPPSGILMDDIEAGSLQKNTNTYYITKEIKNSGKDLRFRLKIKYQNAGSDSWAFFTIARQGPNFDLDRNYKPGYVDNGGPLPEDTWHTRPLYYVFGPGNVGTVNTVIEQNINVPEIGYAYIGNWKSHTAEIDVIILNSEFEIGDNFSIGAVAISGDTSILSEQTYWVITDASKNVDEWNQEI